MNRSSKLQELARKRNWALYQLKGMRGNLNAVSQAGVDVNWLLDMLKHHEELVKKKFAENRDKLLTEKIDTAILTIDKD